MSTSRSTARSPTRASRSWCGASASAMARSRSGERWQRRRRGRHHVHRTSRGRRNRPMPRSPSRRTRTERRADCRSTSRGKTFRPKATATLNNGSVSKLTVDELRLAGSDLSGVVTNDRGTYFVSLRGKMLDFAELLETRKPNGPLNQLQMPTRPTSTSTACCAPDLGIELSGVSGHLSGSNGQLRTHPSERAGRRWGPGARRVRSARR